MLYTPPVKLGKYPHFVRYDKEIWERYLDQAGDQYQQFWYDVRIGVDPYQPPGYYKKGMGLWRGLTSKRIDVVGYCDDGIEIIEVRHDASVGAIGNMKAYKFLFEKTYRPENPVRMKLITNRYDRDMEEVCAAEGIEYVVI